MRRGKRRPLSPSADSIVGVVGGTVINVTTRETNRVGYAGQLREPASLTVSVPSTNINEAASQQLSAFAWLGTRLASCVALAEAYELPANRNHPE